MTPSRQKSDLAWAVNSPALLSTTLLSDDKPQTVSDPPLDLGHIDPEHLAAFLDEVPCSRVGRYFERLILYWLAHVRKLEVIAHSLPVRDENQTVGEIDLLFRDELGRLTHWEVAVKFYLWTPGQGTLGSRYIGPNAVDTFERKTKRMFEHQLPLSRSYFPDVTVRRALVKGRIFYHPSDVHPPSLPPRMADNHLQGGWLHAAEASALDDSETVRYRVLAKPHWLAEESAVDSGDDLSSQAELVAALSDHFVGDRRPVMVSQLAFDGGTYTETRRWFIVADGWP